LAPTNFCIMNVLEDSQMVIVIVPEPSTQVFELCYILSGGAILGERRGEDQGALLLR